MSLVSAVSWRSLFGTIGQFQFQVCQSRFGDPSACIQRQKLCQEGFSGGRES